MTQFFNCLWWVLFWNAALCSRKNIVPICLRGVRSVQIYRFPLNGKVHGHTVLVFVFLVSLQVWETEKITLVVALRICFLDRIYFFNVMSIVEPFGLYGLFFSGSYDSFGIPHIIFICISISCEVIPTWYGISSPFVDYKFETLSCLDENVSLEAFEIWVESTCHFINPSSWLWIFTKYLNNWIFADVSSVKLEVNCGHKPIL